MIFNKFDPNQDVVAGRITRVASGFWPNGSTNWSQTSFEDDFWDLTGSVANPSYGTSVYDVKRTMYYVNVYPSSLDHANVNPYFSLAYGHVGGDVGSGSFGEETASIKVSPAKAIYNQYKNLLLGTSDLDGLFTMTSGSTTLSAKDIWIINMSAYKMKDKIDEGLLEFTLSGSGGNSITLIDNSRYLSQTQAVYQLISGSLASPPNEPTYEGLGLFYPNDGIIILNASASAAKLGLIGNAGAGYGTGGPGDGGTWPYTPGTIDDTAGGPSYTYNHKTLAAALQSSTASMQVRKSEYVPSRHYFVRVKNRDFNYSNNPTYVYDGTDGIHAKGTIFNTDFITDPKTYITTVGLYNDKNELVAVAKLSRPAVKSFDQELLIKIRLDM